MCPEVICTENVLKGKENSMVTVLVFFFFFALKPTKATKLITADG